MRRGYLCDFDLINENIGLPAKYLIEKSMGLIFCWWINRIISFRISNGSNKHIFISFLQHISFENF